MEKEEFLSFIQTKYAANSPEYHYSKMIGDLLISLNLPKSADFGFGIINVLESSVISFQDGRSTDDFGTLGTIEDIAEVVAELFCNVNSDPIWWKARYPIEISKKETQIASKEIRKKIKALNIVREI